MRFKPLHFVRRAVAHPDTLVLIAGRWGAEGWWEGKGSEACVHVVGSATVLGLVAHLLGTSRRETGASASAASLGHTHDAPPAASTMRAMGAASKSNLSLA